MKQEKILEAKLIEEQRKQVIQEEKEMEKKDMLEKIKFKQRLDGQLDEKQTKINKAYQVNVLFFYQFLSYLELSNEVLY